MDAPVDVTNLPAGTHLVKRADGTVVVDERTHGSALHTALSVANKATDSWKKWRDIGAFGFLLFIMWQGYKDFVRTQQDNHNRLENVMNLQTAAIDRQTAANQSQAASFNTAMHAFQSKQDAQAEKFSTVVSLMRDDMVADRRRRDDQLAQDQKAMAKFLTVLDRIDRKLPAAQAPPPVPDGDP